MTSWSEGTSLGEPQGSPKACRWQATSYPGSASPMWDRPIGLWGPDWGVRVSECCPMLPAPSHPPTLPALSSPVTSARSEAPTVPALTLGSEVRTWGERISGPHKRGRGGRRGPGSPAGQVDKAWSFLGMFVFLETPPSQNLEPPASPPAPQPQPLLFPGSSSATHEDRGKPKESQEHPRSGAWPSDSAEATSPVLEGQR